MPEVAEFFCDVDLGTPQAEVTWYKERRELTGGRFDVSYISKDKSACLTINKTELSDSGEYHVVIKNDLGEVTSSARLTVHQAPEFTKKATIQKSQLLKAGTTLNVLADLVGFPEPTVEWTLDGQPLTSESANIDVGSGYTKLVIRPVTSDLKGTLKATATNSSGKDELIIDLEIIDSPSAPKKLETTNVTKDSISVGWNTPESDGGSPITSYVIERKDLKRNTWVTAGNSAADKLEYTITKLMEGNSYSVRVSAMNDVGQGPSVELPEAVIAKNQFTVPGAPQDLKVNDVTESSAQLTWSKPKKDGGSPITGYVVERKAQYSARWSKASKSAVPDTEMTLTDLVEGTEYEFRVAAENKAGLSEPCESVGPITAQAPKVKVVLTTDLQDVCVKEDAPAVFECVANKRDLVPVWKKNGGVIHPTEKYVMKTVGNKYSLTVQDCQPLDEAEYEIILEEASSQAGLTVEREPIEMIKPLEDIILTEMPKTVVFVCEVSKAGLNAKWIRNGQPLESSKQYHMSSEDNSYKLQIRDATQEDEAEYMVLIKGLTSSANLKAEVKPSIKLNKKYEDTVIINAGKTTIFEVPFQGYPKPEVAWMFDGKEIPRVKRIEVETTAALTCLRLKQAERGDSGDYSVSVNNEVGSTNATIALVVLDKPDAPQQLEGKSVDESTVELTWKEPQDNGGSEIKHYLVEKREANKRSWVLAGKVTDTTLRVANLVEGQGYSFQVKAVNAIGESESVELPATVTPVSKYGEWGIAFAYFVNNKCSCFVNSLQKFCWPTAYKSSFLHLQLFQTSHKMLQPPRSLLHQLKSVGKYQNLMVARLLLAT